MFHSCTTLRTYQSFCTYRIESSEQLYACCWLQHLSWECYVLPVGAQYVEDTILGRDKSKASTLPAGYVVKCWVVDQGSRMAQTLKPPQHPNYPKPSQLFQHPNWCYYLTRLFTKHLSYKFSDSSLHSTTSYDSFCSVCIQRRMFCYYDKYPPIVPTLM